MKGPEGPMGLTGLPGNPGKLGEQGEKKGFVCYFFLTLCSMGRGKG